MALLSVNGLKKSYVTRVLFEDISFEVEPGDHIGFIRSEEHTSELQSH